MILLFCSLLCALLCYSQNGDTQALQNYRMALTYGGISQQDFTTQSLALQFNFEERFSQNTNWTYRLGAGYARGFERALITDTKASRLNEFTAQGMLNINLGDFKKQDLQLGFGPFVSYINGSSDRFTGGDINVDEPATRFGIFKTGAQGMFRLSWYGDQNIHAIMGYARFSNDFFTSIGFGYEIGI